MSDSDRHETSPSDYGPEHPLWEMGRLLMVDLFRQAWKEQLLPHANNVTRTRRNYAVSDLRKLLERLQYPQNTIYWASTLAQQQCADAHSSGQMQGGVPDAA